MPIGSNWIWTGNNWLGNQESFLFNFTKLNASCNVIIPIKKNQDILVDKLIIDYAINGANTNTRYWSFSLFRVSNAYAWTWLKSEDSKSNWFAEKEISVNQQDILSLNNTIYYLLQITRNSNPGNLDISGQFIYRQIN